MIAKPISSRSLLLVFGAMLLAAASGCARVSDTGGGGSNSSGGAADGGGDGSAAQSCVVNGTQYASGDQVPSLDGCNDCTCTAIGIGCTKKACVGTTCGGISGVQCEAGEYCKYAVGDQCGASDATGMCSKKPGGCTDTQDPVCGCDSKTYSDACHAGLVGVSVATVGACGGTAVGKPECSDTQPCLQPPCACIDDNHDGSCDNHCPSYQCSAGKCVDVSQTSCGGFGGSTCTQDQYCSYTLDASCGAADATGLCLPKPTTCAQDFGAVCGCDGRDYSSACQAAMAGTSASKLGTCK